MKKHIYVAGPMTRGDMGQNVLNAIKVADALMEANEIPFLPHVSHFWAMMNNNRWSYEKWLEYDHYWVTTAKAIIRLPGPSKGADQEVRWAHRHSVPVYNSVQEYIDARTASNGTKES